MATKQSLNMRLGSQLLALVGGLAASHAALAMEYGTVLSSTPIVSQVNVPQQVCHDEQQVVREPSSGAGAIIGAIAGGLLGHTIGAGSGRALATGVGVVAGAVVGDNVENADARNAVQTVRRCVTAYSPQSQVVGYQVEYEYAGQRYTTQMRNDPGRHIALQVQPQAADQVPVQGYSAGAPVASVAAPMLVYGAPAPVAYVPAPVSINVGWGYGYGYRGWGR